MNMNSGFCFRILFKDVCVCVGKSNYAYKEFQIPLGRGGGTLLKRFKSSVAGGHHRTIKRNSNLTKEEIENGGISPV